MPFVRGRVIPEIESAGPCKRFLDVLLWSAGWKQQNVRDFDEIAILHEYLRSIQPPVCNLRFLIPAKQAQTVEYRSAGESMSATWDTGKNVRATCQRFLDALKAKSGALHALFTDAGTVEFIQRISYLRHYASHRGSLAPTNSSKNPTMNYLMSR